MRQISLIFLLLLNGSSVRGKESTMDPDENCDTRCNDDVLVRQLASCEILNPESIINLSVKEVELICRKLDDTLNEIEKYLKTCTPPPPGNLFMTYIAGMKVLNTKMCSADSNFLKRFGPAYPCLHELRIEYEGCSGPADWTEEGDNNKICKIYKSISDCYYIKTAKVCGIEAANTMKELVTAVIDGVLCMTCKAVKANPYIKDAMPEQYLRRNEATPNGNMVTLETLIIIGLNLLLTL